MRLWRGRVAIAMEKNPMNIDITEFTANCLKLIDEVATTHQRLVISMGGKPLVEVVPIVDETPNSLFGYMKGTVTIHGDTVAPSGEVWSAESGDEDDLYQGFTVESRKPNG